MKLGRMARRMRCAPPCAEKHPADRRRALIADSLAAIGARVLHLIEPERIAEHRLNPAARSDGTTLIHDRSSQPPLPLGD